MAVPVHPLRLHGANRGCPLYQRGGFRPHEPACLYLLHLPGRDLHKIGVTNQYEFRVPGAPAGTGSSRCT